MYKKTSVLMAAMLAAIMVVGLTANHAFALPPPSNSGTTNVAIGGDGGIGGAGGAGGTAIGGNGNCHNCGDNGNANANGGHGGNANGGNAVIINKGSSEKSYGG
jgi:hypothetical protein